MNKQEWGPGPWQTEPDRIEWRTAAGLPALMVRQPNHGAWCGYVAVAPGHPAHGKSYDDVAVDVHGGLTYADACSGSVCHVPAPGEPDDVWWLGFDCVHGGDLAPGNVGLRLILGYGIYRDVDYVQAECESLARQLTLIGRRVDSDVQ